MSRIRSGYVVGIVAAVMTLAAIGYAAYVYIPPLLRGTGCVAHTEQGELRLSVEQTRNAALITAVGTRMGLPRRAATIALAAAFQESHIRNLTYGHSDSLGIFQQRPSQGWGTRIQILDPIYAAEQFYKTLRTVESYRKMPVYKAAQAVQRSAYGKAYAQHTGKAKILSAVFTGRTGAGLRCWFRHGVGAFEPRELRAAITRQLGPDTKLTSTGQGFDVLVSDERRGWAAAVWAVANARELGITSVAYHDRRWTAADGYNGWEPAETPEGRVLIRG